MTMMTRRDKAKILGDSGSPDQRPTGQRRFRFIGCEIIYREACFLAATGFHQVDVSFLRKGLHDLETPDMVARIQQEVDAVDPQDDYEAILLGYARCNDGLVGVRARHLPLVIPRAHDCITFFFGSRQAYQEYFDAHPGTYFHTTGWSERNRFEEGRYDRPAYGQQGVMANLGLTESYEEMIAKHGKENADYIIETLGGWEKAYRQLCYLTMNATREEPFTELAQAKADEKNWQYAQREGDWSLLKKLFAGHWDDEFLIVQPGQCIAPSNDEQIIKAVESS
jgi:hypothetical protein